MAANKTRATHNVQAKVKPVDGGFRVAFDRQGRTLLISPKPYKRQAKARRTLLNFIASVKAGDITIE